MKVQREVRAGNRRSQEKVLSGAGRGGCAGRELGQACRVAAAKFCSLTFLLFTVVYSVLASVCYLSS